MRIGIGIVVLLLTVGLVGCGGNDGDDQVTTASGQPSASSSASASAERGDLTAFTNCVRQHGVDVPDPNPDFAWQQAERLCCIDE
jgi:hypothetical protein